MFTGLLLAMAATVSPMAVNAVGKPVGFGAETTGGEGGVTVTPTTIDQLRSYLCNSTNSQGYCTDTTQRIIRIESTFDFRNTLGEKTETGCIVQVCSSGTGDEALNRVGFCEGRPPKSVTYDLAGTNGTLLVGSNKTIIGVNEIGIIKGTGFKIMGGVSNVIIQNIQITDINDGVVWGGDAILINGANNVWIDHNYFARIGRQMIATGYDSASNVTISNNIFDGNTNYGTYCDGDHYWLWLFLGASDTITLYGNYIQNTSGRGPHSGGLNNATIILHMVNNYFINLSKDGAIMSLSNSSYILAEGNYFQNVTFPVYKYTTDPGLVYAPFDSSDTSSVCSSYIQRCCVANQQIESSSNWNYTPADTSVLSSLSFYSSSLITPEDATTVPETVTANAGVGIIDSDILD